MQTTINVAGYDYHVTITGNGAPYWLFFHGFLGNQSDFQAIHPKGTCVYVTLYGFGAHDLMVPAAGFKADQQVASLQSLITQLALQPVNIVGYSMGARLALCLAVTAPQLIQHLILESGTPGLADPLARQERQQADTARATQIEATGLAAFVDHWEQLPLFHSQQVVPLSQQQRMHAMRMAHQPINMANSLRYFGTGTMPNQWPNLSQLTPKTTIITGELDHKFTNIGRQMVASMPTATQIIFPATGHNVHFEQPQQYQAVLNHFSEGGTP
ncbi:2-succinyl-6-hydroxy-2,4-cyclohexadiene-1-carboxylate synthase [Fructilactobacillus carniphilus]|uniref:Putative 2-succinyl-6-hydroxy-2,4-cyclohexadiene-1-carboxylate synthase n=1 Tax=Fructilactobacillus carniphilus TaxID=2940297 RepID=A0ABY5BY11_9LACO|nr:2-succinyl-6-hydroxy-2,4-cyclohexadiene-1-carboxylate synthase [Fructilactobacillus carniphilus]USS90523.1 2-succinyl-6-hydroxy-2,4-cyclohexadiene-1-carboxylate synthase [Fructilactobacillus carniphilus]